MKSFLSFLRYFPADILFILNNKENKANLVADVLRYVKWDSFSKKHNSTLALINYCLSIHAFRNVFYFRLTRHKILRKICMLLIPELKTIEINGQIGPGLLISHNFSVIMPKSAGQNLRIGPGVVIGRNGKDFPTIGNNVYIASNSTVIGNIHIGNNVIVGAGSVVTKDIPDNSVAVGNPAKVIKALDDSLHDEIM